MKGGTGTPRLELAELIADQARDMDNYTVQSFSLDRLRTGADFFQTPRRLTASDDRHGSLYCYVKLECRCPKCRAASAAYQRNRRRRTQQADWQRRNELARERGFRNRWHERTSKAAA